MTKHSTIPRGVAAWLAMVGITMSAAAAVEAVKVSSLGYDAEDSTRFLQQAFDSGARKVVVDRQAGPWYTLPLKLRSNTELVLEPGVELVAKRGAYHGLRDFLLELDHVTNVVVRGGPGATLRMWKQDYQGPDYRHGEWRYALRIFHGVNVLVDGLRIMESGGDGIGVTGRDIVIRNCVCDRNHRQGISVFDVENLLIEDCVLSNTDGTAPMSGIDIEPDRRNERLVNVKLRNVLSSGNSGCGFQLYLANLDDCSEPVSISFENCRSVGNSTSAMVTGTGPRSSAPVKGMVRFDHCRFESPRRHAIDVGGSPATAFDVVFRDCVVSNANPGARSAEVTFSASQLSQGQPDGIRLDNLVVHQAGAHDWFVRGRQGVGPLPTRLGGTVTIVSSNGTKRVEKLDASWVVRNFPVVNGGRPLPPRLTPSSPVQVVDTATNAMVALEPVTLLGRGAWYVFYMEKPGRARFAGRQVNMVKGRPLGTHPFTVTALGPDGRPGRKWTLPMVSDHSTEFGFDAPHAGFYRLRVKDQGTRFHLERSSVPVAVDVTEGLHIVAARSGKPFSLWFEALPGQPFALLASGDHYYRFRASAVDPSGRIRESRDVVRELQVFAGDGEPGLWRVDFARAVEPHYDWIPLDLFGAPGFLFLSKEKYWRQSRP